MTNPGYDEKTGEARFQTKDRDDPEYQRKVERAERIELERAKNRWSMGRMFKFAMDLLFKR